MHSQLKCWDFDLNEIEFWIKEGGCLDENGWSDNAMVSQCLKGWIQGFWSTYLECIQQLSSLFKLYFPKSLLYRVILPRRKLQINSKFLVDSWVNGCDSQKDYFFLITLKPNIRYWWDFLPNLKNLEYEFSTKRTKLWPIHIKINKPKNWSK